MEYFIMNTADPTYLKLLNKLVTKLELTQYGEGTIRQDRTEVGTVSLFGEQMRFNLAEGFPILTTKKVHFPSVVSELLWFLKGDTNIKYMLEHNNHIWTDWRLKAYNNYLSENGKEHVTRETFERLILKSTQIEETWGDIGKGYGHQWRNFGEVVNYRDHGIADAFRLKNDVIVKGFDQISWVINEIKTNPTSRRLLVSGWNPQEIGNVDLPPCHTLFQFFVEDGKLSSQLYQRSADMFLGVPFNIASYALLTNIIAKECNLSLGEFIWTGGDVHLYSNHLDQAKEQCSRSYEFDTPKLKLFSHKPFDEYEPSDFELINYKHHPAIKAPVAV